MNQPSPSRGDGLSHGPLLSYLLPQRLVDEARRTSVVDETFIEARQAEASGFRGVFVSEHHQREHSVPSPLILAAALARETRTVDIGVAVVLLPLYHPVRLLEDAACVDVLSGGRLILGIGAGYAHEDFDLYGLDPSQALESYDEGLAILEHGWERATIHSGKHFQARINTLRPRTLSNPRPRVWLAGSSPGGVRRAARFGDAWVIGARTTLAEADVLAEQYRQACAAFGKVPSVAVVRDAWVARTDSQAHDEIGRHVLQTHHSHALRGHVKDGSLSSIDPAATDLETFMRISEGRWLIGSRERVRQEVAKWQELVGAVEFILRFRHPTGPSHAAVLAQIARFGREIGRPEARTSAAL